MFSTVPINSSRYSPVLRNSTRSNSVEPSCGKRPSTKSTTSSQLEEVSVLTSPPTAGPSVPLKHPSSEAIATVQCNQVLDFIVRKNREKYSTVFSRVTPRQYNSILHASEKLAGKPRLAYDFETLRLEVDMPSCVHDSATNVIRRGLESVDKMLHDLIAARLIHSEIHPSLTLNTGKKEFVPDCVHVITARCKPPVVKILSIVEVAFSQSEAALLDRFRNAIKFKHHQILSRAGDDLNARNQRDPSLPPHHSALAFLSLRDEPQSFDEPTPVIVEGHSWCTITDIQVQVWVRGRRGAINIDTKDSRLTARGSLFPVYNEAAMKDVTLMVMKGLELTRDCFVEQCRLADRDASVSNLRSAQLPLPFKWEDIVDGLTYATQATAHARYLTWYHNILEEQSEEYVEVTGKRTADEAEIDTPDDGRLVRPRIGMKTRAAARSASYG
ncbi:uncharacterized protein F5891DRAFT_1197331 [Suillus fuscotomentosus]|uniref:Uncharacterized protein n=1 Tax=Suillus fuscotomentosus TaxID=1912939 RepID=A0AAD4DS01_9AGAM|nr:uncharacterized protein F5891DRAFT_1197331 [Suillus fuscotomentosus]KAG1891826.1 hypothetical protein F5891DRAFT_1197331 [Suillus fuscotomentosus]